MDETTAVTWGYPTLIHFFLAGMGGASLAISAILLILSRYRASFFSVARYAAFIAPIVVFDDAVVLVLELGRPTRFLNIFQHVNFESPLWIGAWMMMIFLLISVPYAYTYLALPKKDGALRRTMARLRVPENVGPDDKWHGFRWTLALIGLPLGIAVCHYPGLMMSGLVARPLWSTSLLPTVTLLSSTATALAAILLCRVLFKRANGPDTAKDYRDDNYMLTFTNVIFLIAEALVLTQIVIYARNTSSSFRFVIEKVIGEEGILAEQFWTGVVTIGFAVPIITGVLLLIPRLVFSREPAYPRPVEAVMPSAVLVGSLMLIYVLLFGGQLTSPIGV